MDRQLVERRFKRFVIGLAAFLTLDGLLLVPVLVFVSLKPWLLWLALTPYLVVIMGALVITGYLMHRWGIIDLGSPWAPGMLRFFGMVALLTVALVAAVIVTPTRLFWMFVLLYLWVLGYVIYRMVKWHALYLAFQCSECHETFRADIGTWLMSSNAGSRTYAQCSHCGKYSWAQIIELEES